MYIYINSSFSLFSLVRNSRGNNIPDDSFERGQNCVSKSASFVWVLVTF